MVLSTDERGMLNIAFNDILNHARGYPGGNLARFVAEQQVRGMITCARFTFVGRPDADLSLTKLEDIYIEKIQKELNY